MVSIYPFASEKRNYFPYETIAQFLPAAYPFIDAETNFINIYSVADTTTPINANSDPMNEWILKFQSEVFETLLLFKLFPPGNNVFKTGEEQCGCYITKFVLLEFQDIALKKLISLNLLITVCVESHQKWNYRTIEIDKH